MNVHILTRGSSSKATPEVPKTVCTKGDDACRSGWIWPPSALFPVTSSWLCASEAPCGAPDALQTGRTRCRGRRGRGSLRAQVPSPLLARRASPRLRAAGGHPSNPGGKPFASTRSAATHLLPGSPARRALPVGVSLLAAAVRRSRSGAEAAAESGARAGGRSALLLGLACQTRPALLDSALICPRHVATRPGAAPYSSEQRGGPLASARRCLPQRLRRAGGKERRSSSSLSSPASLLPRADGNPPLLAHGRRLTREARWAGRSSMLLHGRGSCALPLGLAAGLAVCKHNYDLLGSNPPVDSFGTSSQGKESVGTDVTGPVFWSLSLVDRGPLLTFPTLSTRCLFSFQGARSV